jgi:polyhydroxybutyrate depolymerase
MKLTENHEYEARPRGHMAERRRSRVLRGLPSLAVVVGVFLAAGFAPNAEAAMTYTAGRTTIGPTMYTGQQNVLSATQVQTGSEPGSLTTLSIFVGRVHAAPLNHMHVAIYADNGANAPGSLVAQSSSKVLQANALNAFAMPSTTIAANTSYWLVFNVDGSATQVPLTKVTGGRIAWTYPKPYGTWPPSYGTPSRPIEAKQYSIYMTYTSADTPPPPPPPAPPPPGAGTSGCGLPVTPGTTSQTIAVGGVQRTYLKVVPASLHPNSPAPIIMGFHGGNDTAENANAYMGVTSSDPVLYVYPQAAPFADAWAGWNVDPAGADFPYVDAVLTDLESKHCVDSARVFATGKSNGGFFVNSLLCQRPGSFRAAASVAGGGPQDSCSTPKAFMGVHGSADSPVPITTGRQSRDYWLRRNQYANAAAVPVSPSPCVSYPGTLNPVVWCEHSGGHVWPSWAGAGIRSFFLGL